MLVGGASRQQDGVRLIGGRVGLRFLDESALSLLLLPQFEMSVRQNPSQRAEDPQRLKHTITNQ